MGNEAKWEYFRVMYERYHEAKPKARPGLLDEFCVTTGYNRKYAIRLLNGARPGKERVKQPRGRKARYGKQMIFHSGGDLESGRLSLVGAAKALLPNWMPWIRKRYRLSQQVEKELLAMSARQNVER